MVNQIAGRIGRRGDPDRNVNMNDESNSLVDIPEDIPLLLPRAHPRAPHQLQWALGIVFLILVAIIWTFASVLVQYIFHTQGFKNPFFLTYMANSLFGLFLPLYYLGRYWHWVEPLPDDHNHSARASFAQTFQAAKVITPLWFLANFTYNTSLETTSVTSSTVISSTSVIFTFLFSVCFLSEKFHRWKILGIGCCVAGNVLTIWNDDDDSGGLGGPAETPTGDLMALTGAVMYGAYTTTLRHYAPTDDHMNLPLFFGLLGTLNFVTLFPVVVVFHLTDVESLSGLNGTIFGLLLIKGLLDNVLSDYLWARAVILTSPTVATIGLSLTIPLAMVSDELLHGHEPTTTTCLAGVLVIVGFICINVATKPNDLEALDLSRKFKRDDEQPVDSIGQVPLQFS